jgi:hypothetical protein
LARRKRKGRGRGRTAGKGRSTGTGRRARSATKKPAQRSTQRYKRTTVITETKRGRGPKRTTSFEEVYEEEW